MMDKKRNGHTLQTGTGHLYLAMAEGTTDGWELGIVLAMIEGNSQTGCAKGGATSHPETMDLDCRGRKAMDLLHLDSHALYNWMFYTCGSSCCGFRRLRVTFSFWACWCLSCTYSDLADGREHCGRDAGWL